MSYKNHDLTPGNGDRNASACFYSCGSMSIDVTGPRGGWTMVSLGPKGVEELRQILNARHAEAKTEEGNT